MIKSFRCPETRKLFEDRPSKRFRTIELVARRKLEMLAAAETLSDLRNPPGNRLESLKANRSGQRSNRVNDQFRICYRWMNGGAEDVEIVDYD